MTQRAISTYLKAALQWLNQARSFFKVCAWWVDLVREFNVATFGQLPKCRNMLIKEKFIIAKIDEILKTRDIRQNSRTRRSK